MKIHPSLQSYLVFVVGEHSPMSGLWHHSTSQLYYGLHIVLMLTIQIFVVFIFTY